MSMEEIEKLRARVEKDPNSRLFLPLAEEFRKTGMIDEAISVILHGLDHQPGYTSARVALGRLYLEKNMIDEARKEFEMVVISIPDNLFSHKKLAEIYRGRGEIQKAIAEYEKVLQLNPLDDDAKLALEDIEGGHIEIEEAEAAASSLSEEVIQAEVVETPAGAEHEAAEIVEEAQEAPDEEFEEFKTSFSGMEEEQSDEGQVFNIPEESSFEDVFADVSVVAEKVSGGSDLPAPPLPVKETGAKGEADLSTADSFISGGNYFKAMETYRNILKKDPDNKSVLQRMSELKALMKMLGKSEELVIARLEGFMNAVKKGFSKK